MSNLVRVVFKNPIYNYSTYVNPDMSTTDVISYFVGNEFNFDGVLCECIAVDVDSHISKHSPNWYARECNLSIERGVGYRRYMAGIYSVVAVGTVAMCDGTNRDAHQVCTDALRMWYANAVNGDV